MSKVIFRFEKLSSWGKVSVAASHNLRHRPTPSADPTVSSIVIKGPTDGNIPQAVRKAIGEQTIRKNAVLAMEVIISASPKYFRPTDPSKAGTWQPERLDSWRQAMEPWIAEKFSHAASVVLHLDESTPHYQIIDVPLVDGKLNARGKYGGDRKDQTPERWQDDAAAPVAHLGIERGLRGSLAKHERIRAFYRAANAPMPVLPPIKTKPPGQLPERTFNQKILLTQAKADRDRQEAENVIQQSKRGEEIRIRNAAAVKMHPQLADKGNAVELAQRKQKQAEATAEKMSRIAAENKGQADQLRAMSLPDVLTLMYGAVESPDSKPAHASRKFDLPDGRQVAVTGDKWIQQGDKGIRGAINMVKHLDNIEFKAAVRLMSETFDSASIAADHSRQLVAQTAKIVVSIKKSEPVPTPAPEPSKWPKVRQWLETVRGIPTELADWLNKQGIVFADERGDAVFKREMGGAFVHGAGDKKFHRAIGNLQCGPMILMGKTTDGVYLVEAPIDAIAVKAMHPHAIVLATGGNLIPPAKLKSKMPFGAPVFAAFDNGKVGNQLADEATTELGAQRYAPPERFKDWAECVHDEPWRIAQDWSGSSGDATMMQFTRSTPPSL